jgi:hypothetical protein
MQGNERNSKSIWVPRKQNLLTAYTMPNSSKTNMPAQTTVRTSDAKLTSSKAPPDVVLEIFKNGRNERTVMGMNFISQRWCFDHALAGA